jgi:hypothetical protein
MLHVKKNRIGKIRTKRELPVKKGRFLFLPSQGCRLIINFFYLSGPKSPSCHLIIVMTRKSGRYYKEKTYENTD